MPIDPELAAQLMGHNKIITDLRAKIADLESQIKKCQAKVHFGDWSRWAEFDPNVTYTATSDGFVCVLAWLSSQEAGGTTIAGYSPIGRKKFEIVLSWDNVREGHFTMPVRAGDNWMVEDKGKYYEYVLEIYWLPLVSG